MAFSVDQLPYYYGLKNYLHQTHALPTSASEGPREGLRWRSISSRRHRVTSTLVRVASDFQPLFGTLSRQPCGLCEESLYKEGERRRKNAARSRRQEEREARANDMSLRDAVSR